MTVGLVFIMTGCGTAATDAPTGDALYRSAEAAYLPFARDAHSVLMAVHEGEWAVDQGQHGALPVSCQRGADEFGYMFVSARTAVLQGADPDAIVESASAAFAALGVDAETSTFGSGDAEERNVVATGGSFGRAALTLRPVSGELRFVAQTDCLPGEAFELGVMVFGDDEMDSALRLPAFETPESVPQFYFPADGPAYYNEDGTPIIPQPVVTDPPVAPYGE